MTRSTFHRRAVLLTLAALLFSSCDSGFDDMNTNPTQANEIQPDFLFTTSLLATAGTRYEQWRSNLIYPSAMIQHLSHTWWAGDKYSVNEDWISALWTVSYNGNGDGNRAPVKLLTDLIARHADDPTQVNKVAAARIMRVYVFSRLTDMYGDIPYFEAGKGFLEDNVQPAYTPQSEIYADMLKELDEAVASFDPSQPMYGTADLLYEGDIDKWRKFGNSLMLRLGMRLVKVDANMAQQWVQDAVAGGVMESNADAAVIHHQSGPSTGPNGLNSNGVGDVFETDSPMLTRAFVSWMQDRGDPRLEVLAATYDGNAHAGADIVSNDPADQVGYPVGNDATTIQSDPFWDADRGFSVYSQPNRVVRDLDDPTFFQTYAEVALLQAEAVSRGWIAGDAGTLYAEGVRAAMEHLSLYDAGGAADIPAAEIDAYLAANPFEPSRAIEQINEQLWAALFLNGIEAWSNWRRTGYPVLQPVDWPGNQTGGTIPRRMTYPQQENALNGESYSAAVARQGPDAFTTRVWWDV